MALPEHTYCSSFGTLLFNSGDASLEKGTRDKQETTDAHYQCLTSFPKSFPVSCLFNFCKPRKMVQNVLYSAKNKCTLEILSTGLGGS